MASPLAAALVLASQGIPVFPCRADKKPFPGSHGFHDARTEANDVRALFARYHNAELVGVATGAVAGFDVLDLDTARHETAVAFLHSVSPLATRAHQTQSGGFHFFFRHKEGRNNTARHGVDIRGDGGYVIWWPAQGFAVNPLPIAEWPPLLWARLERPKRVRAETTESAPLHEGKLGAVVRLVSCAKEGSRNNLLFWAACRIGEWIVAGEMTTSYGETVLCAAARAAGLDDISSGKTIASGLKQAGA